MTHTNKLKYLNNWRFVIYKPVLFSLDDLHLLICHPWSEWQNASCMSFSTFTYMPPLVRMAECILHVFFYIYLYATPGQNGRMHPACFSLHLLICHPWAEWQNASCMFFSTFTYMPFLGRMVDRILHVFLYTYIYCLYLLICRLWSEWRNAYCMFFLYLHIPPITFDKNCATNPAWIEHAKFLKVWPLWTTKQHTISSLLYRPEPATIIKSLGQQYEITSGGVYKQPRCNSVTNIV